MGPDRHNMLPSVPQRPRFSWDMRSIPWTDGVGNQQEYAIAVKAWSSFHENLPDGNPNKIACANRGILLQSNLFGRAKDLCRGLDDSIVHDVGGDGTIVAAVYKKDPLSVTSGVFDELNKLISIRRDAEESFPEYEMRFAAQLARFNALGSSSAISGAISALMLLRNASTDASQRISILAAAAPRSTDLDSSSSTDDYLCSINYETIALVLRQCESQPVSRRRDGIHASGANTPAPFHPPHPVRGGRRFGRGTGNQRQIRLTREQVQLAKNSSQCKRCGEYCHCYGDHNADGSLKPGVLSSPTPVLESPQAPGSTSGPQGSGSGNPTTSNTLHFSTASLRAFPRTRAVIHSFSGSTLSSARSGPLLDSGAPYSAIGYNELRALAHANWNGSLDPLPAVVQDRPYWQYGRDSHASEARKIIGSVTIFAHAVEGPEVAITHLVLEGSSQWVIGQNVTRHCNICSVGSLRLEIPTSHGQMLTLPLLYDDLLQYVPADKFDFPLKAISSGAVTTRSNVHTEAQPIQPNVDAVPETPDEATTAIEHLDMTAPGRSISTADSAETTCPPHDCKTWKSFKPVVDRVHKHICGHADYGDIKLLLERINICNEDVARYLKDVTSRCGACRASKKPPASRTVSLSTLSRSFNDVVCIEHLFLDELRVFHVMDTATRYSAGTPVDSLTVDASIVAFESTWISNFWAPVSIYGDQAFATDKFEAYAQQLGSSFCPIPPRRHSKNVLESKHGVIRSIFIRLQHDSPSIDTRLLAVRAIAISNNLCGSDILSAFEMARGFTKPPMPSAAEDAEHVPSELIDAQNTLMAKRKLLRILRSKSVTEPSIAIGDMIEVYLQNPHNKRGKWASPRIVLAFDPASWTVTVPGAKGHTIKAAIEDVRPAITDDSIASMVRDADDALHDVTHDMISNFISATMKSTEEERQRSESAWLPTNHRNNEVSMHVDYRAKENDDAEHDEDCSVTPQPTDRVEIFWPIDNQFYPGTVTHTQDTKATIQFDDGDTETLDMPHETWCFSSSAVLCALSAQAPVVTSAEPDVLKAMLEHFGCKPFLHSNAEAFPGFPLEKAYANEEQAFTKTVTRTELGALPMDANIITSHTLYKVKQEDDGSLLLKARIAPHGNEDVARFEMRSDCSSCAPNGIRTLLSMSVLKRWFLTKIDVSSAFLQTGAAARDVYVVPPRESSDYGKCLWLQLTAAYGLVNANAKSQVQADATLHALGLRQVASIPQLFLLADDPSTTMLVAKIVDDILITGEPAVVEEFVCRFDAKFKLGTITKAPGVLRFFGLNIIQAEDCSLTMDGDDKLEAIESFPLTRLRRRQSLEQLNSLELRSFRSVNCSVGWLGVTVSPFCAHFNSRLQQLTPDAIVKDLAEQHCALRELKSFGTSSRFERPQPGLCELSIVCYSDAGRDCDAAQLSFVVGLLFGHMVEGSVMHVLAWQSRKSQRPVKSVGAAEILACGDAITQGKLMATAFSDLLRIEVPLIILVDSKDLFDSLSTQRNSVDISIRADVAVIRHEFEMGNIYKFTWIPGRENLADAGTKRDSPLRDALRLLLSSGRLPITHSTAEHRVADQPLG